MRRSCMLAEIPDFGQVFDCGQCGNLHLTIGAVSLTLTPDAFMQLVALIHSGAANFETWLAQNNPEYGRLHEGAHPEGIHADEAGPEGSHE